MKKLLWIILPLLLVVTYALNIYPFLSNSHPVKNADVLVVEGWLPPKLLDQAVEEFNNSSYDFIATTGVPFLPEFRMPYSGFLTFDLKDFHDILQNTEKYLIEIEAYSTPVKKQYAEMSLFLNDSLVLDTKTSGDTRTYSTKIEIIDLKKLTIWFKNDAFEDGEDRDLIIVNVKINNITFEPRNPFVKYDVGQLGGDDIYSANFKSVAEEAALLLQRRGIPKERIVAVPTEEREINRTYNSALAFGNWLESNSSNKEIKGINIISMGTHSRRSWILFKQHINKEIPVGIISLKTSETPDENWWKTAYGIKRVLTESIKYVYTLFL